MCGIAAIYRKGRSRPVTGRNVERMIATMPHRGPDARGVCLPEPHVGLGHLRLAVLDLVPESNQPFESTDGRYCLTYNGEIYNYIELRSELAKLGHRFRTASDTEVLLAAYAEWGHEAVQKFNGMWAFAIYDRDTDSLFCSRDRFGAKPLYFAEHGGTFLLASEIKALLAVEPTLAEPDFTSLSRFFRASVHSEPSATFFDSVRRLQPAHNLLVTATGTRTWRYWDYPTDTLPLSREDAADAVRELLTDAVALRLRSDVPVGTSLSGGLDSATIACLVRTVSPGRHLTFTASFPGERFDEAPRAGALATSLGMEGHPVSIEPNEIVDLLGKVVHHMDAPTQCPAVIPLWNIMATMHGKVVVALDGQGSDELFGGYIDRVFGTALMNTVRRGDLSQAARDMRQHVQTWGWWTAVSWSARDLVPGSHRWYRRLRKDEAVYARELRSGPDDVPSRSDAPPVRDSVNRMLRSHHEGGLRTLLQYGDAMSMAHSIEVRMPYLDFRLVELGFRLPGSLKVNEAQGKVVLRDAVRDIVPSDIREVRRKLGFATPLASWLRAYRQELVEDILFGKACRSRGLFDHKALRRAVDRHLSGKVDLSSQIFRWITAELWFQDFID